MDLLTDVLRDACVRPRVLALREIPDDVALRFPCSKSIGLHVVVQGAVHVHAPSLDVPLALTRGDIAVMARGCDHALAVPAALHGLRPQVIGEAIEPGTGASAVVSGAFELRNAPLHPFFAELPPWIVLRAADRPRLGALAVTAGLIEDEFRQGDLGTESIVQALLDVVFAYAVREIAVQRAEAQSGWSHAVCDAQIRRAVTLMHDGCAQPWTLDELARQVGLSRTALAKRFRAAMGDTPLNYLRTLRMQRAMKLLAESERNLEAVASAVGYQDAFGFSKVFKRTVGMSPKAFRQRDAVDRPQRRRFVRA